MSKIPTCTFAKLIPRSDNQTLAIQPDRPDWLADFLYAFGAIHLILSLWMVIEYYAVNWPHFSPHGWANALIPTFVQNAVYVALYTIGQVH